MVLVSLLAFAFNSNVRTTDEKRQDFENNLLQTVVNSNKVLIHNQGIIIQNDGIKNHNEEIIIHNQMQFAKFGMNGTPDIRTDFQRTETNYWTNFTH